METFNFICLHCSSPLRVRDRMFIGRQIGCPECGQLLQIVETPAGFSVEVVVVSAAPHDALNATPTTPTDAAMCGAAVVLEAAPDAATGTMWPARFRAVWNRLSSTWRWTALAGAVCAGATVMILPRAFSTRDGPPPTTSATAPAPSAPAQPVREPAQRTNEPVRSVIAANPSQSGPDERLANLGAVIQKRLDERGEYPPATVPVKGLPPDRRLGWMAALASQSAHGARFQAVWDRPWQDPLNDAFVRRRLFEFQNPAMHQLTGADGYPAAHFAGIAGVGANARRLSVTDRRAGIFGDDRTTRLSDVKDGAAQTWLVTGVQDHLGAWASGGSATVRSLTREPYVNGFDGLGSGQPDSMFVLMADGAVKQVGAAADPRIVRRMAAMADGLSLDLREPGEPGDEPPMPPSADKDPASPLVELFINRGREPPSRNTAPQDLPLEPTFADEPTPANSARQALTVREIEAALSQPIMKYAASPTAALEDEVREIVQIVGVKVVFDAQELGPAAGQLRNPIQLKLTKTTLREILERLLQAARLTFRIEPGQIRLTPKPVTGD